MNYDELCEHIRLASDPDALETHALTADIVAAYWPGGVDDRSDPVARHWLRRWRPQRTGTPFPVCTCLVGRCGICN